MWTLGLLSGLVVGSLWAVLLDFNDLLEIILTGILEFLVAISCNIFIYVFCILLVSDV